MNNVETKLTRMKRRRRSQAGMTLIEALVAVLVFTVVFLTALALYQTANRAYLRTDAATIQQQNIRFAMDRVTEVLRDAGANHNALGSRKVADEQIEGAWESAIFVRGDFDNSREQDPMLESGTFPIVTTGNDEIVGFVLRKPGANDKSITLKIDTSAPRDAIYTDDANIANEEPKTIEVAARTLAEQTNPPYQLTKVTFDEDGDPVYEVIADNIFRLSFKYYPATGIVETITATTAAGGGDTERDERKLVRRIEVNLIGMTDRPDMGFQDSTVYTPAEGAVTKAYRKLPLSQRILGINLGRKGNIHYNVPAIELLAPGSITACSGHCRRYLVSWPASTSAGVTTYRLEITAAASGALPAYSKHETVEGLEFEFEEPQADIDAGVFRSFSFRVAPYASSGVGDYTTIVTRTSQNPAESTPSTPQNVSATTAPGAGVNAMGVTWDQVTTNTGVVAGTCISSDGSTSDPPAPWNAKPVDLTNYRVFRVRSDGTNDGDDATTDISSATIGELQNTPASATCETCESLLTFTDKTAAPCTPYFYRVTARDLCNVESGFSAAMTSPVSFPADAGETPAKPTAAPLPVGAVYDNGVNITATLTWPYITRNSAGEQAAVSKYVLERYRKLQSLPEAAFAYYDEFVYYDTIQSGVISGESKDPITGDEWDYRFYVRGVYDCDAGTGGPRIGPQSDPYDLKCTPDPATHSMTITEPAGATFTRPVDTSIPLQVTVTGSGWGEATIVVKDGYTILHTETLSGAPNASNQYNFTPYDVTDLADGTYTVSATVKMGTCIGYAADTTFTLDTVICGVRTSGTATVSPTTGANADRRKQLNFKLEATCPGQTEAVAITIDALSLIWSGVPDGLTANVTSITYNGVPVAIGLTATTGASGTLIPLNQVITIPATGASNTFTVTFNRQMSEGTAANDERATWTSIAVRNKVTGAIDEALESGSITPNN